LTEKVIQNNTSTKYEINKYQYRAFDDDEPLEFGKPVVHKHKQMDAAEQAPTPTERHEQQDESSSQISNGHAETLLKKIDELSTSLIKMEMQMERQQADFNARLEDDKKRAYDDGFNAATAEFDASYKTKCEDNDKMLTSSVKKLEGVSSDFETKLSDIEKELAKTAVSIAEQVIKKEISEGSSKVALSLARELLSKLKDASKIKLKVNKIDSEYLKSALEAESKISIEEDDAIQRGGVIALSDIGNLDGNISSRFLKVKEDLLGDHD
jgi:flagellar assembly protein FliH